MKPVKVSWKPPDGMSQDLLKIFEKYRLGVRAMLQSVSLLVFWNCRTDLRNGCRRYDDKEPVITRQYLYQVCELLHLI
jgi:hypothetical protein